MVVKGMEVVLNDEMMKKPVGLVWVKYWIENLIRGKNVGVGVKENVHLLQSSLCYFLY
jgi:hypothetical protein